MERYKLDAGLQIYAGFSVWEFSPSGKFHMRTVDTRAAEPYICINSNAWLQFTDHTKNETIISAFDELLKRCGLFFVYNYNLKSLRVLRECDLL